MNGYWLVKSEPEVYSIADLQRDGVTQWDCVRNYQARNNLRAMKKGDKVLFYHSNSEPAGVAGVAKVVLEAYPDPKQFDKNSEYYDPKASKDKPIWFGPDLKFEKRLELIPINLMRKEKALSRMLLLKRGIRLSVQPVTEEEFEKIVKLHVE